MSVTYAEALEVALTWGWIDGQKRKLDDADAALQDLRKGLVMGRAVLMP